MNDTLKKSLVLLGLDQSEIQLFLTAYKLGSATIPEIASQARLKRSTAYLLAKRLIERGFLIQDQKDYAKKIHPLEPNDLLRLLSGQQRRLRRQEIELEEALPQLKSLYQASSIRPKVRLFEGNTGLMFIWHDILSTKNEILLWTNQQTENEFFNEVNHNKFIAERLAKKIPIRVLATNSPESQQLHFTDSQYLRQTKILPSSVEFSAETYIYDHKIAQLDYNKDIIGIITESLPLSDFQKSVFELTWNNTAKFATP